MRGSFLNSTAYGRLLAPEGTGNGAAAASAATSPPAGAAAAPTSADPTASSSSASAAAGSVAATDASASSTSTSPVDGAAKPDAAAAAATTEHTPSLLEAAVTKAKPAEGEKAPETSAKAETVSEAGKKPAEGEPAKDATAETKPGEAKEGDAAADVKPPQPVQYEAFKTPETIKLDDARLKEFTDIVGPAQVPQDVAQKLVDYGSKLLIEANQAALDFQRSEWTKRIDTWKTQTRQDSEIGGNRLETSLSIGKAVVEQFLNADERKEFYAHVSETQGNGMGNYVLFNKLLNRIGNALNIFEDSIVPAASAPGEARSREPGRRGWYGNSKPNGQGAAV